MSINKNVLTVFLVIEKLRLLCSALLDTCVCAAVCASMWVGAQSIFLCDVTQKNTFAKGKKKLVNVLVNFHRAISPF